MLCSTALHQAFNWKASRKLDCGNFCKWTTACSRCIWGNYVHLSIQKFSNHVVEKCLMVCNGEARSKIIHELLSATYFEQLLQEPHANYVIQTAVRVSEARILNSLVDAIDSHRVVFAVAKTMQKELGDLQRLAGLVAPLSGRKWLAEELQVVSESKEVAGDLITDAVLDEVDLIGRDKLSSHQCRSIYAFWNNNHSSNYAHPSNSISTSNYAVWNSDHPSKSAARNTDSVHISSSVSPSNSTIVVRSSHWLCLCPSPSHAGCYIVPWMFYLADSNRTDETSHKLCKC